MFCHFFACFGLLSLAFSSCCQCLRLSTATFLELCALLGQSRILWQPDEGGGKENAKWGRIDAQVETLALTSVFGFSFACSGYSISIYILEPQLSSRMICNLIITREFFVRISTWTAFCLRCELINQNERETWQNPTTYCRKFSFICQIEPRNSIRHKLVARLVRRCLFVGARIKNHSIYHFCLAFAL